MTSTNQMEARSFVRNAWYAAAWTSEVCEQPLARTILGEPLVLFRNGEGSVSAFADRCPHRLAPLSLGSCENGRLRCTYHGMEFDGAGNCVHIPGQDTIPPGAAAKVHPTLERYGLVWTWMGEQTADPALLPVVHRHGEPGWDVLDEGYQRHAANYRICVENLMDPAHTTFLHKQTIANAAAAEEPVKVERQGETIVAYRWVEACAPTPFDRKSREFGEGELVDRGQFFIFSPPCTSLADICTIPAGTEKSDAGKDSGIRNLSYKFLTPESESATHLFWLHVRNHRVGDTAFAEQLRGNLDRTFIEDRDIAEAIQQRQEQLGVTQFTALAIDRAPVMAVREIDRTIARESKSSADD